MYLYLNGIAYAEMIYLRHAYDDIDSYWAYTFQGQKRLIRAKAFPNQLVEDAAIDSQNKSIRQDLRVIQEGKNPLPDYPDSYEKAHPALHRRFFIFREGTARLFSPIQIALITIHTLVNQLAIACFSGIRGVIHFDRVLVKYAGENATSALVQLIALPVIAVVGFFSPKQALQLCTYRHLIEPDYEEREKVENHFLTLKSKTRDRVAAAAIAVLSVPLFLIRGALNLPIRLLSCPIPSPRHLTMEVEYLLDLVFEPLFLLGQMFKMLFESLSKQLCDFRKDNSKKNSVFTFSFWHTGMDPLLAEQILCS